MPARRAWQRRVRFHERRALTVPTPPTRAELEAALCWDASDLVPRRPAMTAFRQRARLHQARWREREGHRSGHSRTHRVRASIRGRSGAGSPSRTVATPARAS